MPMHVCDVHRILYNDYTLRECDYCGICLHPQQLVLTDRGYMPVSFVKEGWKVLSHDGRFHKVLSVLEREYEGEMVKIHTYGSPFPIIVTPDHLLLVGKVEHSWKARYVNGGHVAYLSQVSWMEAKSIRKGFCMFIPFIREDVDVNQLTISSPRVWGIKPRELKVRCDANLMRLIGYYLAEGCIVRRKTTGKKVLKTQRPSITVLYFGKNDRERYYALDAVNILSSYGLNPYLCSTKYGYKVSVYSVSLAEWLLKNFNSGASKKRIPLWVKLLPGEKLNHLLEAYIRGDGTKDGDTLFRASTVSRSLALDIRDIAIKLGYSSGIRKLKGNDIVMGRKVNVKPVYVIGINTLEFCSSKKVGNRYWHMGGAFYTMVKSVEKMHYKGKVYDLQVEGAHSFVGPSCTYHNCHAWICKECMYSPRRILAFLKSKGISWEVFKKWLNARHA